MSDSLAATDVFGTTRDGRTVERLRLSAGALSVALLTYGARIHDLRLAGVPWPLTLATRSLAAYEGAWAFVGPVVGPVANRIAGARAPLDGRTVRLVPNEGPNLLHGGAAGTHAQIWRIAEATAAAVRLTLDLADGVGGFPGNRRLSARFELTAPATLTLTLEAETDAPTWISLANHSYWTLDDAPTIAGQRLTIAADRYLPTDAARLPLRPAAVAGTPFDFRRPRALVLPPGLDHCFCLAETRRAEPAPAARLEGRSGVTLALETTEPGLQVYDGAGLAAAGAADLAGRAPAAHAGIALEPEGWPDAPNRPDFPSVRLDPGTTWRQVTRWRFARA